jgi:hypothetical protein
MSWRWFCRLDPQLLGQGRALDSRALRSAMEAAFGASDAEGAWVWKEAILLQH